MKKVFWTIICMLIAGGALTGVLLLRSHEQKQHIPIQSSRITLPDDTAIRVTVADTEQTREQGLSGVPSLDNDEGMLFIFDVPGKYAFWMKDMLFPLDIIWISQDWNVVDITPNLSPDTYPQSFAPKADAQYVLEVPAGFAGTHHIEIGQSLTFSK